MIKKREKYLKKLQQVNHLLGISNATTDVGSSSTDDDMDINPAQCSGVQKKLSDFSCSEECTCDRCIHVKFAARTDEDDDGPMYQSTPLQGTCKFDFVESQDEFKLKFVAETYISDIRSKLERLNIRVNASNEDDYHLEVIEKMEKLSADIDSLL